MAIDDEEPLPPDVERTLEETERRVFEALAADEALARELWEEGALFVELFSAARETRVHVKQLLERIRASRGVVDDAAREAGLGAARGSEVGRERLRKDLAALDVARRARRALSTCARVRDEILERARAWGGDSVDAEGLSAGGAFPLVDVWPQRTLAFTRAERALTACVAHAEEAYRHGVLSTGFTRLDGSTGGLLPGRLWRLRGDLDDDVTPLLLQIASSVSKAGAATALLSLVDGAESLVDRLVGLLGGVRPSAVGEGFVTGDTWLRLATGADAAGSLPLWIASSPLPDPVELVRALGALAEATRLRVVLLHGRSGADWLFLDDGIHLLRKLAERLDVAIVLASSGAPRPHADMRADVELELYADGARTGRLVLDVRRSVFGRAARIGLERTAAGGFSERRGRDDEEAGILEAFRRGTLDLGEAGEDDGDGE